MKGTWETTEEKQYKNKGKTKRIKIKYELKIKIKERRKNWQGKREYVEIKKIVMELTNVKEKK